MRLPRYACVDGKQDLAIEILWYHIFTNRGLANFHGMLVRFDGRLALAKSGSERDSLPPLLRWPTPIGLGSP